ncbi:MAG TPA: TrmJ/YjtD family RNA methyltransferase [Vicinamibacteria bacterium]|nr:TrmJ/YjtD family RNA methyltransferase [Vicinamibacteria bacterium]
MDVAIVLVRPARAANVAAACRAMKNMGLAALRLVGSHARLRDPTERALAYGAFDVLDGAREFPSLREAVADATFVVATSGRLDLPALAPRELAQRAQGKGSGGRMAVVFGPEASGLTSDELRLCHATVRIPTDAAHSSLNLAQAVLVVAYELFLVDLGAQPSEEAFGATAGDLEDALADLRGALLAIGYLPEANPEPILGELRALLARASPTLREVSLLRGVARQVAWAGRRIASARGRDA